MNSIALTTLKLLFESMQCQPRVFISGRVIDIVVRPSALFGDAWRDFERPNSLRVIWVPSAGNEVTDNEPFSVDFISTWFPKYSLVTKH